MFSHAERASFFFFHFCAHFRVCAFLLIFGQALEAGLHVLMEKPMTADVAQARALHELSAARPHLCFALNNTANWQPGSR